MASHGNQGAFSKAAVTCRGSNNLDMRATWQRRRTNSKRVKVDRQELLDSYGLSPRGQARQPILVHKEAAARELLAPTPSPPPDAPRSPRVRFTVEGAAPAAGEAGFIGAAGAVGGSQTARVAPPTEASEEIQQLAASAGVAPNRATVLQRRRRMLQEKHDALQERISVDVKRSVEAAKARDERQFQDSLAELKESQEYVNKVYSMIRHADEGKLQKAKKLHKEWEEKVFDKIQAQVVQQVDSLDIFELETRKISQYTDFIKQDTKLQEGVKGNVVIRADYDPYAWKSTAIRYSRRDIVDPLKRELCKIYEEQQGIDFPIGEQPQIPRARVKPGMVEPQMYDGNKLKSTPHGIFAGLIDGSRAPKSEMVQKIFRDDVTCTFNDFSPVRDLAVARQEAIDCSGTRGRRPLLPPSVVREKALREAQLAENQ